MPLWPITVISGNVLQNSWKSKPDTRLKGKKTEWSRGKVQKNYLKEECVKMVKKGGKKTKTMSRPLDCWVRQK